MANAVAEKTVESPLVVRAKKDYGRDLALSDEAKEQGDIASLHALCRRLADDRKQLAEAFDAMISGWALMRDSKESSPSNIDAISAIERTAHEAIAFAREVVQAITAQKK